MQPGWRIRGSRFCPNSCLVIDGPQEFVAKLKKKQNSVYLARGKPEQVCPVSSGRPCRSVPLGREQGLALPGLWWPRGHGKERGGLCAEEAAVGGFGTRKRVRATSCVAQGPGTTVGRRCGVQWVTAGVLQAGSEKQQLPPCRARLPCRLLGAAPGRLRQKWGCGPRLGNLSCILSVPHADLWKC